MTTESGPQPCRNGRCFYGRVLVTWDAPAKGRIEESHNFDCPYGAPNPMRRKHCATCRC